MHTPTYIPDKPPLALIDHLMKFKQTKSYHLPFSFLTQFFPLPQKNKKKTQRDRPSGYIINNYLLFKALPTT